VTPRHPSNDFGSVRALLVDLDDTLVEGRGTLHEALTVVDREAARDAS
jgi:hypothetical protein